MAMLSRHHHVDFARLLLVVLIAALCCRVVANTAAAEPIDFTGNWWVVRAHEATTPPDSREPWLPRDVVESREFRLSNPTEPGQSLWLKKMFPAPAGQTLGPWVLSIDRRLLLRQVILNDQTLTDLEIVSPNATRASSTQNHRKQYAQGQRFTRWDQPARMLIDGSLFKVRGNTLFLQVWDLPGQGDLLGDVTLRRAEVSDMVQPFAHQPSAGDMQSEKPSVTIGLQPRFALAKQQAQVSVRITDQVGRGLRDETNMLELQGLKPASFTLTRQSDDEYKAVVSFTLGEKKLDAFWVYLSDEVAVPRPSPGLAPGSSATLSPRARGLTETSTDPPAATVQLERVHVTASTEQSTFTVHYRVSNHSLETARVKLSSVIVDDTGQTVALSPVALSLTPGQHDEISVTQPRGQLQTWSPWQPVLHELVTTLQVGDNVTAPPIRNRIGLREWSVQGRDLHINRQQVHLAGITLADNDLDQTSRPPRGRKAAGIDATTAFKSPLPDGRGSFSDRNQWAEQARWLRAAGVTLLRDEPMNPFMLAVCDEVGLFTGVSLDVPLNHPANESWQHQLAQLDQWVQHPSLLFLQLRVTDITEAQATDAQITALLNQLRELRERYPTLIISVEGWGDLDGHDCFFNTMTTDALTSVDEKSSIDDQGKPTIISAGSTYDPDTRPGYGHAWLGDIVLKHATHPSGLLPPLGEVLAQKMRRENDLLRARQKGTAVHWVQGQPWLTWRHIEPWLAAFDPTQPPRLWAGEPTSRKVWVGNDSGVDGSATVQLTFSLANQPPVTLSQTVTLATGHSQWVTFDLPAFDSTSLSELAVELRCIVNDLTQSVRYERWTLYPRSSFTQAVPAGVAVLDPTGDLTVMLHSIGAKVLPIHELDQLSLTKVDLAIISADIDPAMLTAQRTALLTYLRAGGKVLMLLNDTATVPLPRWLNASAASVTPSTVHSHTFIHAGDHPAVEGLLPHDLHHWLPDGRVQSATLTPPLRGLHKTILGRLPAQASLIEEPIGSGRILLCTLNLNSKTVQHDPAAARLMLNLLKDAQSGRSWSTNKTLVLSPADSADAKHLRENLGLLADYVDKTPEKLDAFMLLILTDWPDAPTPAPGPATGDKKLAEQLREFVNRGGTLLVRRPSTKLMNWLSETLNLPMQALTPSTAAPGPVRWVNDPLLSGISDADFVWATTHQTSPVNTTANQVSNTPTPSTLWFPEGGFALTDPAVLVTRPMGRGRLIIDQTPIPPANTTASSLSSSSSSSMGISDSLVDLKTRFERALLVNLRADVSGSVREPMPLVMGFDFHPIDLQTAANRSRLDKTGNDQVGFLDQGEGSQFTGLPTGKQRLAGVDFQILPDQSDTDRSIIMLRSKDRVIYLPTESQPISIGRKANVLFFLHSAAWHRSPPGTPVWEYEIHYADNPPADDPQQPRSMKVPVRSGIDVGDWWGRSTVPGFVTLNSPQGHNVWVQRWNNPQPDRPIANVVMRSLLLDEIPMLLAVTAGSPITPAAQLNLASAVEFNRVITLDRVLESHGLLENWLTSVTHRRSLARFSVEADPVQADLVQTEPMPADMTEPQSLTQNHVLVVRNLQPPATATLTSPAISLRQGQQVAIAVEYLTMEHNTARLHFTATGSLQLHPRQPILLTSTAGQWRKMQIDLTAAAGQGDLHIHFTPQQLGENQGFWLRDVRVQIQP